MPQIKVWKTQEYFVYFKFFKLHSWGKRSVSCRRRFIQRFPRTLYFAPCHPHSLSLRGGEADAPQGGLSCPSGNSPPGNLRSRALRLLRIFGKYVLLCQEIATGASALAMTEERTIPGKRIGGQLRKCWCALAGGPCRPRNDRGKSITDCAT